MPQDLLFDWLEHLGEDVDGGLYVSGLCQPHPLPLQLLQPPILHLLLLHLGFTIFLIYF